MPRDRFDDFDNYSTELDIFLDVPFVPTDEDVVDAMLSLVNAGPEDTLYDLGSGDGRIVIAAARDRDTRSIGVEVDPSRIADAMEQAEWAGVDHLVDFIEDDIFTVDFSEATIVTLYLLQSVNMQLRPKILNQLRPGTRIVSHDFDMGDWRPDDSLSMAGANIYKWTVPAQVAGTHEWTDPAGGKYRLELRQTFQEVTGEAWLNDRVLHLESAILLGNRLDLSLRESRAASPKNFTLNFLNGRLRSVITPEQNPAG